MHNHLCVYWACGAKGNVGKGQEGGGKRLPHAVFWFVFSLLRGHVDLGWASCRMEMRFLHKSFQFIHDGTVVFESAVRGPVLVGSLAVRDSDTGMFLKCGASFPEAEGLGLNWRICLLHKPPLRFPFPPSP